MKKILLILIGCLMFTGIFANDTLIITTQNWAPYIFKDQNANIKGIATDILEEVLNDMDIKYQINIYPWARAQHMVEAGKADAFYAASKNSTRDTYAKCSKPFVSQKWFWYTKKNSNLNPSNSDFKQKAVTGAILGSNMSKYLQKEHFKIGGTPNTTKQLIKMLNEGRVNSILVNSLVMKSNLKELNISENDYKKTLAVNKPLGIYFSEKFLSKNQGFLDKFNDTLQKNNLITE